MSHHVVVGAGATGAATARLLAAEGEQVTLVSRRGTGPDSRGIKRVAADANDADFLAKLAVGAKTLFNCAMPPYDNWPALFPPLSAAVLTAAERTGANYVLLGNCYGYAPSTVPVNEDTPLAPTSIKGRVRVEMWEEALESHRAGRVRATEVRASDYIGAGAGSLYTFMVVPQLAAGLPIAYPGDLDAPHSWSYTVDVARTLIAAAQSNHSWGRAWHVPPVSNISPRALTARLARIAGVASPELIRLSASEVAQIGKDNSIMAEISEMLYMLEQPFVMDAALTQQTLGVTASSIDVALEDTLARDLQPA